MRKFIVAAAVAVAILCSSASSAEAAFKIRISDGTTTRIATDNVLLDSSGGTGDTNATTGFINYSTTFGGFTVTVALGASKPNSPNGTHTAFTDITVVAIYAGGGSGQLTVDLTDTGFSIANLPGPAGIKSSASNNSSGAITQTFQSYVNYGTGGSNEFGGIDATGGTVFTTGLQGPVAGGGNSTVTSVIDPLSNPFSISSRTVITFGATGTASIDNNTTVSTPAPAGLLLAITGMPMLGLGAWFRRRNSIAA